MSNNNPPIEIPANLYYTTSHEWARLVEGEVEIGITAHAVQEMGRDIVHVELPAVGQHVKQLEPFGVIDSVKAAFDLFAPVGGEVIAVNPKVAEDPSTVARAPYTEGWMVRIRPDSISQFDNILNAERYKNMLLAQETQH